MKDISGTRFRQPSSFRSSQLCDETHIMNGFHSSEKSSFLEFFRLVDLSMASERLGGKTESSYVRGGHARARIPENACAYWHARIEHTLTLSITRIAGEPIRRNPAVRDHVYGLVRYSADEREPELWPRGEEEVNKWSRQYVVLRSRASSSWKISLLTKSTSKRGIFPGATASERDSLAAFAPVGRTKERRSPGRWVWGKRNEKVSRGRGGKSSNVNTKHVAMRRKHPTQPAFLQRVPWKYGVRVSRRSKKGTNE